MGRELGLRGVGGKAEDLMPATGYWDESNQEIWVQREGHVENHQT